MKELALHILDIVQNSIQARADLIEIQIEEDFKKNRMVVRICDNGSGISDDILPEVTDAYTTSRTTRKVGMGLPLLKHHAEATEGYLKVHSEKGKGTIVEAMFVRDHIDRQPLGDIAGVIKILLAANPEIVFVYSHSTDEGEFSFSSDEAKKILEIGNFNDYHLLEQISSLITENLKNIEVEI